MKALLLVEKKKLELIDMPAPRLGDDELLVRVRACGICGSDVHGYDGSTGRRIPPIVMGHEAAGEIAQVGRDVRGFSAGQRITFDSTISCGACRYCRAGQINLCDSRRVLGVSCGEYRQNGCFAEYVSVPARIAYALPDGVPFEQAAMVEAVSIAVHAVGLAGKTAGQTAVVIGAGMIGQLIVQTLRAAECGMIIATDVDPGRLARAKSSGASHALDANEQNLAARIEALTNGGADVVFDAVGSSASFSSAIGAVRKGKTVVLVGNLSPTVSLPLQIVVTRQIALLGSCASAGEYPECLELLAQGKVDVRPMISATAPLEEGAHWFERLYAREAGVMKVILTP